MWNRLRWLLEYPIRKWEALIFRLWVREQLRQKR
jgi:hypothetical protein